MHTDAGRRGGYCCRTSPVVVEDGVAAVVSTSEPSPFPVPTLENAIRRLSKTADTRRSCFFQEQRRSTVGPYTDSGASWRQEKKRRSKVPVIPTYFSLVCVFCFCKPIARGRCCKTFRDGEEMNQHLTSARLTRAVMSVGSMMTTRKGTVDNRQKTTLDKLRHALTLGYR